MKSSILALLLPLASAGASDIAPNPRHRSGMAVAPLGTTDDLARLEAVLAHLIELEKIPAK